ncbi:NAD(P)H-binding protein [Rubrivivax rivuli]|uniref:NAD(P)-binding domain-containing protein n=1 Tax=Rubrivivax rivuli TaxID=1862385 RepID=A0A437R8E5_9BURK|nr:NAD(P)H-binding protein [Rubrivivax rivuli]RVU43050.1 hypothetical protein EOE66_21375 [Rubrivivax rivuli]
MRLLLAGATGLIGQAVMAQWAAAVPGGTLHALVRRPLAAPPAGVQPLVVDFSALPALPAADAALCALGTTIKTAGSQAAFRAVDFDAVLAFARAAQASGVRRFAVVSALGASARSGGFYNRVKGEMEAAVTALGFETLLIARPSLLTGDRSALGQPPRRAEALAQTLMAPLGSLLPAAWRPIAGETVARALLHALHTAPAGVQVLDNGRLHHAGSQEGKRP